MKKKEIKESVEAVEEITEIDTAPEETSINKIAEELKKQHRQVYVTNVAGINIIWRNLKRSEYKEVMLAELSDNEDIAFYEKQDLVAKKVILYPENVEELLEDYAGISDIIASETMIKTGFGISNTRTV